MFSGQSIRVRPMELGDFSFVRDLAAQQSNFTIPPPYVLWLLTKIRGGFCVVAEHKRLGLMAYLLAVPISRTRKSILIWQLARVKGASRVPAIPAILRALKEFTGRERIRSISFSASPGTTTHRMIQRYSFSTFGRHAIEVSDLPSLVAPNESEFLIDLQS